MLDLSCVYFIIPYIFYFIASLIIIPFLCYLLFDEGEHTQSDLFDEYQEFYQDSNVRFTQIVSIYKDIETIIMEQFPENHQFTINSPMEVNTGRDSNSRVVNLNKDVLIMEDIFVVEEAHREITDSRDEECNKENIIDQSYIIDEQINKSVYKDVALTSLYHHVGFTKSDLIENNFISSSFDCDEKVNNTESQSKSLSLKYSYNENNITNVKHNKDVVDNKSNVLLGICSIPELDVIEELIKVNFEENIDRQRKYLKKKNKLNRNVKIIDSKKKVWPEDTVLLAGDSILNDIDAHILSKKYKIKKRSFPGISIDQMIRCLTILLLKKPRYVILHLSTSDAKPRKLTTMLQELLSLKSHVLKCLPSAYVVTCCPMIRNEDVKPAVKLQKVID